MNLDPYDILGISPDSDLHTIKQAYKIMLMKTHPDKMGDAKYFMMVHEAYNKITNVYKSKQSFNDMPSQNVSYSNSVEATYEPKKMENFSNNKFNTFFENNRIDPGNYMNKGYGMNTHLQYQEDFEDMKKTKCNIPNEQMVIYKEPEPVSSGFDNCYQYGVSEINDFTGGGGVDINKAYCNKAELVDTVQRHKSLKDLQKSRSQQSFNQTEEDKKTIKKREKELKKLEELRLSQMNDTNEKIRNMYISLNNRLN